MTPDRRKFLIAGGATVAGLVTPKAALADANTDAAAFIKAHVEKIRPLEIASNKAWWTANITGKDEDFKTKEDAQNKIDEALADKPTFAKLKALKEAKDKNGIADKLVARPLLSIFFPPLASIRQPLGGECAAHRRLLEQLPFIESYGVESALLIDAMKLVGIARMVQVDLGVRQQTPRACSPQR